MNEDDPLLGPLAECMVERDLLQEALQKLDVELRQQGVISERVGRNIIDKALAP